MIRSTLLLLLAQGVVGLDNFSDFVREIIAAASAPTVEFNRRSNCWWRHGQHSENKPIRPCQLRVKTHQSRILVFDFLKDCVNLFRTHLSLAVALDVDVRWKFVMDLAILFRVLWQHVSTPKMLFLPPPVQVFFIFLHILEVYTSIASLLVLAQLKHLTHPFHGMTRIFGHNSFCFRAIRVYQQPRAVVAYAPQNLKDSHQKTNMDHRLAELNMTKVPRALVLGHGAGMAFKAAVRCTHPQVEKSVFFWDPILLREGDLNLTDGSCQNVIWIKYAKLDLLHPLHLNIGTRKLRHSLKGCAEAFARREGNRLSLC
mmetsp:Transcript_1124/g.1873  ORF Transcript_1124/g.1873 Transcript_1124/m.1873 type:complete len:314 (+) Transcript_1124:4472-5413(+)